MMLVGHTEQNKGLQTKELNSLFSSAAAEKIDPLAQIKLHAKDPGNAYPGAQVCSGCQHIMCMCRAPDEKDPEIVILFEQPNDKTEFSFAEFSSDLRTDGVFFAAYKPTDVSLNSAFHRVAAATRDLGLSTSDSNEDNTIYNNMSDAGIAELLLIPGQTSFHDRVYNLIETGHPDTAVRLLDIAIDHMNENNADDVLGTTIEAHAMMVDRNYDDCAKYLKKVLAEHNLDPDGYYLSAPENTNSSNIGYNPALPAGLVAASNASPAPAGPA